MKKSIDTCPQCGKTYKCLGNHWQQSSQCSYPELTDQQIEITTGLLMGDGWLNRGNKNPQLGVKMEESSLPYLYHVSRVFGPLGRDVRLVRTAKEGAEESRKSGFSPEAREENYSDIYQWMSRGNPELHKFDWYGNGKKTWPDDIDLTPTVLKTWYASDGCWDTNNGANRIKIGMANEVENTYKVDQYFEGVGLPTPSNYNIGENGSGRVSCSAVFSSSGTRELFDYMGDALSGFEYKWPEEHHATVDEGE